MSIDIYISFQNVTSILVYTIFWIIIMEHTGQGGHRQTFRLVIPPLPGAGVCAARLPASRDTLRSNTRPTQPYGRVSQVTPGLEWAGHRHAAKRPIPGTPCPHLPAPAQVTRGHYTSQLLEELENPYCIPSSDFPPKGYGCCLASKACGYLVCFPCSPTSFYRLDLHDKTCIALANLQWNICRNGIENQTSSCLVMVNVSVGLLIS